MLRMTLERPDQMGNPRTFIRQKHVCQRAIKKRETKRDVQYREHLMPMYELHFDH